MLYADCRLRPMAEEDRARVLSWRNQDRIRVNMYNSHVIAPDEHDRWFDRAVKDASAVYRIFEHRDRPLGFVSFTGLDRIHGRSSWAFYLGEADAPRGSGAAMELLALDEAFGPIGIRKLCCEVFAFNAGVVRLHARFGFVREGLLEKHHLKDGEFQDIVCLARFADGWATDRAALMTSVFEEEAA
jgi:UDP-4-amino-4,6-dideoxy-N-acetyl-beta-L-altrosamine N-acetyltransferase